MLTLSFSLIFVPAIGADPKSTWSRQPDSHGEEERLDIKLHDELKGNAHILLYDHLTEHERSQERASKGASDEEQRGYAHAYAQAEADVAKHGVIDWADRLLEKILDHRETHRSSQRPLIFICHSTGGIVVKHALIMKVGDKQNELANFCLGVTFFATPHHGSKILSEPQYVHTVGQNLGLKWEMSERLRDDFSLRSPDLEDLNYKFALSSVVGMKIHSYVESADTFLDVLSADDSGGESRTVIRVYIVDSRSGGLGTSEAPVEEEDVVKVNTTHVGLPRFTNQDAQYEIYLREITKLVQDYRPEERFEFQRMNKHIMTGIKVDVHQFYGEQGSIQILSTHPTLESFLELGPARCMEERIRGQDKDVQPASPPPPPRPSMERHASEPAAPTIAITAVDDGDRSSQGSRGGSVPTLSTPSVTVPTNIHTRRPSLVNVIVDSSAPDSPGHLTPRPNKAVHFSDSSKRDTDTSRPPQRSIPFKLPSRSTDRFKWIHIPSTHPGWVPHVLTTISKEKKDLGLHSKLLMNQIWFSQHNQSRHASPHARFVRPSVKCLFPEGIERHPDDITTPVSACNDMQFVVYLPYLHWDTYANMKKRADVIKRRRKQYQARPIPRDIAHGKSMEHKVIWQYLTLDRPYHCRRTLDQYGYPSLRNTTVRDDDQILYKRTKPGADASSAKEPLLKHRPHLGRSSTGITSLPPDSEEDASKVLMVDQLWLWIVDNETVVTFFAPREPEAGDSLSREGDIRSEIYQDINGDFSSQCNDPFDFAALAVSHAIKALLSNTSDQNLQVFRVFEEYISILTEKQNASFKEFRDHRFEKTKYIDAERHLHNREDLNALLELRDIDDELNTMEKLLKDQHSCVSGMLRQYAELYPHNRKGVAGTNFLHEVDRFLNEHKEHITGMRESAKAAREAFKDLLDMKQKQANIIEAHLARDQTKVAADQSRTVMIFTIFTIIFLPLSFFASVFGINAKEWQNGPDGSIHYLSLHDIFTYMIVISLAVIVVALLAAFSRPARRLVQWLWRRAASPIAGALASKSTENNVSFGNGYIADPEKAAGLIDMERYTNKLSTISRTQSKIDLGNDIWSKQWSKQANGYAS